MIPHFSTRPGTDEEGCAASPPAQSPAKILYQGDERQRFLNGWFDRMWRKPNGSDLQEANTAEWMGIALGSVL